MTDLDELILDLRAHAHEAPAVCSALMRRAANELGRRKIISVGDVSSRIPARSPAKERATCA